MKTFLFLTLGALSFAACSGLNPSHHARYQFEGKVLDESGKPISKAIVKVRGWETITDAKGQWKQSQIVKCGALRDDMAGSEEADAILITAKGYDAHEEEFKVIHPRWFSSCKETNTNVVFDTVMKKEGMSKTTLRQNDDSIQNRETPKTNLPSRGTTL